MEGTSTVGGAQVGDLTDLADEALLSEASEIEVLLREGEVHKLRVAYQWAVTHPPLDACETPSGPVLPSVRAEPETLGDTDELPVRRAKALGVIADAQARLDLTSLVGTADPDTGRRLRQAAVERRDAKVRLYLHASLADVVADDARATGSAESLGPVSLDLTRDWAGRSRVTIQPVLHVATDDRWSVDRHDPPPRMAEQVRLRDETCVFPWCGRAARQCDLDHREPFVDPGDGGPPGQTSPASLAPLCRRHHRAKTAGEWSYERADPGTYLWTGPVGMSALVTARGTIAVPRA